MFPYAIKDVHAEIITHDYIHLILEIGLPRSKTLEQNTVAETDRRRRDTVERAERFIFYDNEVCYFRDY